MSQYGTNANRQYGYQQPAQNYGAGATGQVPTYGTQPQKTGYGSQPVYPTAPATTYIPPAGGAPGFPGAVAPTPAPQIPGMLPLEQSYIENILRLNKGKLTTVYTLFETTDESFARTFKGIIEAAGRDHLILSDPQTGMRYLIPMVYFAYATFDEELEYDYPFGVPGMTTYTPR
ncbi:spore coat protein GerQ [Cytobacillus sp. FJAT-54145]|uniref:Spore coat protein GerQ n=1 Tax=Cytobacillus spartinae TaxID=3299023 RepID=A0ABW6KCJ0_9BACI